MSTYQVLMILSGLVIFSYLFDMVAKKTRLPSVLLLLGLGIGLHFVVNHFGVGTFNFLRILPALGTVGLILIVFEGALDLNYDPGKNKAIRRYFLTALVVLILTTLTITIIFSYLTNAGWYVCFTNAIPFSVISSTIAIPSAAGLSKNKREMIIYESSFSDILGIIFFNFAISDRTLSASSFIGLAGSTIIIIFFSIIACLLMLYILGKINHSIKFFVIISILVLIYAIGQTFHLSSLILVLAFGLLLNNVKQIKYEKFRKFFLYDKFKTDLVQLHQLSAESAFLIRTFFFIIFGFTMDMDDLKNPTIFEYGAFILLATYVIRFLCLKVFTKGGITPEVFISPRGLISILLFYNIPSDLKLEEVSTGLLFLVILATSIIMSIGILTYGKKKSLLNESDEHHSKELH